MCIGKYARLANCFSRIPLLVIIIHISGNLQLNVSHIKWDICLNKLYDWSIFDLKMHFSTIIVIACLLSRVKATITNLRSWNFSFSIWLRWNWFFNWLLYCLNGLPRMIQSICRWTIEWWNVGVDVQTRVRRGWIEFQSDFWMK